MDTPEARTPFSDLVRTTTLARPDWRWYRAKMLVANSGRESPWTDDQATLAAVEFIHNREGTAPPCAAAPNTAVALAIFEANGQTRWQLEALILADIATGHVAKKLGLDPEIVALYESVFFDVRSCFKASSWFASHVFGMGPYTGFAPDDLGSLWRWVGYCRGERFLDHVVAVTTGVRREEYPEEDLETAELFVLNAQVRTGYPPERLLQLQLRMRADEIGAHPSSYHIPRRRKRVIPTATDEASVQGSLAVEVL